MGISPCSEITTLGEYNRPDLQNNEMVSLDSKDLLSLKDGDILFFDEMFNGTLKQTLDAVLNFLEDRILMSGRPLADVMIVAASNPEGMIPLTPQIKERVVLYNISFKVVDFNKYLIDKYYMPAEIASKLSNMVQKESFSDINKWNYNSARSVEKALNALGRGVPHPNEKDFGFLITTNIELPIDLPEIDKVKGIFIWVWHISAYCINSFLNTSSRIIIPFINIRERFFIYTILLRLVAMLSGM